MLLSDQGWLWARGFEGGGPQTELLRRLAHWLMKEPDLEEEALSGRQERTQSRHRAAHHGGQGRARHRHPAVGQDGERAR